MLILSRVPSGTLALSRPPKAYQAPFGLLGIVENPLPHSSALALSHSELDLSPPPLNSELAVPDSCSQKLSSGKKGRSMRPE